MTVTLEPSWLKVLEKEFDKAYMKSLKAFLQEEKDKGSPFTLKGPTSSMPSDILLLIR